MANNPEKVINTANELYISINNELRPWNDVTEDIIIYLKQRVDSITHALVYKGSVATLQDLQAIENPAIGDMYNVASENNNNYAWVGATVVNDEEVPAHWDSLGSLASVIDDKAIEDSPRAIQSGFIYDALMNYVTYEEVQAIIDEVFGEQSVADITRNINQQFSDINQDISDIQSRVSELPDPLVSRDMNNAIISGSDNGLFVSDNSDTINQLQTTVSNHTSNISSLNQRISNIEDNTGTSTISEITNIANDTETITINSDKVMYYTVDGDVTLDFTPSDNPTDFAEKYMYIEATSDINLSVLNAEWSMVQEEPTFYSSGYYILIKVIWIAGKVIIETIDNNQLPDEINP